MHNLDRVAQKEAIKKYKRNLDEIMMGIPEERLVFFAEENPERDELAKPTTLDIVAAILVSFFSE